MDTNGRAPAEEFKITEYVHRFLESRIRPGDLCIDATMGNGADTEFLCKCSGAGQKGGGNVLAFDIQPDALEHTQKRLAEAGYSGCARLILDSHENMDRYVKPQSVKAVTFNLGYLPGGDHSIATRAESTVRAAEKSLQLLVCGGVLSILIYSGKDSGYGEKDAVLKWAKELDTHRYLVIRTDYLNRPGDPPIPLFILKMQG